MKYLILVLILPSFFLRGFSQVETTVWNGKTYFIYPHQEEIQSGENYMYTFADYREVLHRDDKNRKVLSVETEPVDDYYKRVYKRQKMTREKKQQEKLLREVMSKRPDLFYNYGAMIERNMTPALEKIPDGDYIQYYRDLPYLDGNTIRYRNDIVAGVFKIRNNIPEGDAQWFAANGMVIRTGNYSNGSREGEWRTYSYQPSFRKMNIEKEQDVLLHLMSPDLGYDTLMETQYFQRGLKNGAFSRVSNGREMISGFYKNDDPAGTWTIRDYLLERASWGDKDVILGARQTDTLIVTQRYTYQEKPVRGKSVIIREETVAEEFNYFDEFRYTDQYQKDTNKLVLYNDSPFGYDEGYAEGFSQFYKLVDTKEAEKGLELPEEAIHSYEGEEYNEGAHYEGMEYSMEGNYYGDYEEYAYNSQHYVNGKYYTTNELIDSAGYLFEYSFYEEYYRNGQLRMHFELKDGVLTEEDTIFWDNGQAANTVFFDPETRQYVQHFFDYKGKLYKTLEFDEKGKPLNPPVKKHDAVIDGLEYDYYNPDVLHYAHDLEKPITSPAMIMKGVWIADSTTCMEGTLDPETQTFTYTEYSIQKDPFVTQQATFGEDYKNVNGVLNYTIGDLRLERTVSGSLYDFSQFGYLFGAKHDSVNPQTNVIGWMNNYESSSDNILYQKNVPFTGKFQLTSEGSKYKIKTGSSGISIQLPTDHNSAKMLSKALKKYSRKGKKSAILEIYNEDMTYAGVADHVMMLFPFANQIFNNGSNSNYEEYSYDFDYEEGYSREPKKTNKKDARPFDNSITGQFLNGKPEGEWIVKDQFGNITARVVYKKGELEGRATFYATEMPLTEGEQMLRNQYIERYHTYAFDAAPEKKVQYVSSVKNYRNGRLQGPAVSFNWKGDTTSYDEYRDGYQHGISMQRSKLFYALASYEDGQLDGISRTFMTIPGRDSILIFDLNFQNGFLQGESKSYHTNGKMAKRGFFLSGQPIDDYEAFDTLGVRYQYVKFLYNQPVEEKIWEENQLSVRYVFDWKDSIDFQTSDIAGSSSFERLAVDLGLIRDPYSEPYFGRPSLVNKTGINYTITKYYPNDTIAREGQISKGKKTGHWKYFSYEGKALYEVDYADSLIPVNDSVRFKSKGIITLLDDKGKPVSKSWIIEKVEKYDCSHSDHNEERMLYTFWESDSSQQRINGYVKNYYDNGAIMNEGVVENGLPTGVWKLYDSDGNLNQVGTYKLGKRDGRWLSGDLGNVKNMSEICLNPNLTNLEEIMAYQEKLLDISVIYYGMGTVLKREYYGINMNNGDAPENYGEEGGYYGE